MRRSTVICMFLTATAMLNAASTQGLEGYWSGDGNTLDQSGKGRNGWISGNVTYTTGKEGQAFYFTGNGSVNVADSPVWNIQGDVTIAMWANFETFGYSQLWPTLISHDEGGGETRKWMIYVEHNMFLNWHVNSYPSDPGYRTGGAGLMPITFPVGEWHHIAISKNGSEITTYLDAVPVTTVTFNNDAVQDASAPLRIGWGENAFGNNFAMVGGIDEVYFYSRSLARNEIEELSGIPEPASLILMGIGVLIVSRKRK